MIQLGFAALGSTWDPLRARVLFARSRAHQQPAPLGPAATAPRFTRTRSLGTRAVPTSIETPSCVLGGGAASGIRLGRLAALGATQNCITAAVRTSRGIPEESARKTSTECALTSARAGSSGKRPVMV